MLLANLIFVRIHFGHRWQTKVDLHRVVPHHLPQRGFPLRDLLFLSKELCGARRHHSIETFVQQLHLCGDVGLWSAVLFDQVFHLL